MIRQTERTAIKRIFNQNFAFAERCKRERWLVQLRELDIETCSGQQLFNIICPDKIWNPAQYTCDCCKVRAVAVITFDEFDVCDSCLTEAVNMP